MQLRRWDFLLQGSPAAKVAGLLPMKNHVPVNFLSLRFALAFFPWLSPASAQISYELLSSTEVKQAAIPFYAGSEQEPSVVFRAGSIHTDYESVGFLRIGLLPLEVLDDVTIEVRHPENATNVLYQLHDWIGAQAGKRIVLRQVGFLAKTPAGTNRLDCGRARIAADGQWELSGGVRFRSGTNQVEAARATLQIRGGQAGQIVMAAAPAITNNLFACSTFSAANLKENP
jgi:hypothetical protein